LLRPLRRKFNPPLNERAVLEHRLAFAEFDPHARWVDRGEMSRSPGRFVDLTRRGVQAFDSQCQANF